MGAWIEIPVGTLGTSEVHGSHPTWVRGLKFGSNEQFLSSAEVAPHMGAWIEIRRSCSQYHLSQVAPHMGAWIEIR